MDMTGTTLRQHMSGEICCEIQGPRTFADNGHPAILHADAEFGMRRVGAWIANSGYHRSPAEAGWREVSSSRREFRGRESLGVFVRYAESGTEITVGSRRHPGDPEKPVRATAAPAPSRADQRLLRLRAVL
jgi:hypothetical protein